MQAMHNARSKNSLSLVIVSFVVMYVLYHAVAHSQQDFKIFTRCLPYVYFGSQTGGGY